MRAPLAVLITVLALAVQWFNTPAVTRVRRASSALVRLPKSQTAQISSLGNVRALADWTWIQTVLYFAQHWLTDQDYRPMIKSLDLITDLQPYGEEPFYLGGWMVCDSDKHCPAVTNLALKAAVVNPDSWRLMEQMGVLLFLELKQNETAAGLFRQGQRRPGAPVTLKNLEGYMLIRGGQEERARAFYQELYRTAPTVQLRANAARELKRYTMIAHLRLLQSRLQEYVDTYNELPADIQAISNFKAEKLPVTDPFGGRYTVDPAGIIGSTSSREMHVLKSRYIDKKPLAPVKLRRYFGPDPPPDFKPPAPTGLEGVVTP